MSESYVWTGDTTLGRVERYLPTGAFAGACEDVSRFVYGGQSIATGPGDSIFVIRGPNITRYAAVTRPAPGCDRTAPRLMSALAQWQTSGRSRRRLALGSFEATEAAIVRMRFFRLRKGHRPVPRGGRSFGAAGRTDVRFPRGRTRSLQRGVYRITLSAVDDWGNRSRTVRLRLRVG